MSLELILRNQNIILNELKVLREEVHNLNKLQNNLEDTEKKDFYTEFIDLDKKEILKSLKYHDVYYDCKILKNYYLMNTSNIPIIVVNSRLYKYRYKNKWIIDYGGANIKNIICSSIRNTYIKHNTINNYKDINIFILNQVHIKKLSNQKYKNQLFKEFINEVLKI